ncbi:MAG: flagellin [Alphaproteobacteria bacterium]|nr:flagellin [Alphaproteobacteria bacterium]
MVDSLNNANGVLGALKHFQTARRDLSSAETRLSSGLRVNQARDDAQAFQSSASMQNETGSLKAVSLSLGRAEAVSDVAIAAAEQVSKLLIQMRVTATTAMGEDLGPSQRAVLNQTFNEQMEQLERFIESATFDDANILNGSKPNGISFIADAEATSTLSLAGRNLLPGGGVITLVPGDNLATADSARRAFDKLTASIENVGHELTGLGAEAKRVTAQIGFVSRLADALAAGVGRLIDTDLAEESALVRALQVKQSLSGEAINIANSTPQALLALFRG